jgi:hypothetical protein
MKNIVRFTAVLATFTASCRRHESPPPQAWIIAPESIDVARWANTCGPTFAASPDFNAIPPMDGLIELWSGNGTASCYRNWYWNNSAKPVIKRVENVSVFARSETEIAELVTELFEPMLPPSVHPQLRAVIRRKFTPVTIDARGFSFWGGYQESTKSWSVVVGRTPGVDQDR